MMEKQEQEHEQTDIELICIDPESGEQLIDRYFAETLAEPQKNMFENHLLFCVKCQEDVEHMRWVIKQLKTYEAHTNPEFFFRQYSKTPLPVHSLYDRKQEDLTENYYGKTFQKRLAASAGTSGKLAFPITVAYADGQVIGQFRKVVGQLFFQLKKSTICQETFACLLVYTPASAPGKAKTFELHEGDDIQLGPFHEFVASTSIQGFIDAIKQFHLQIKRQTS